MLLGIKFTAGAGCDRLYLVRQVVSLKYQKNWITAKEHAEMTG